MFDDLQEQDRPERIRFERQIVNRTPHIAPVQINADGAYLFRRDPVPTADIKHRTFAYEWHDRPVPKVPVPPPYAAFFVSFPLAHTVPLRKLKYRANVHGTEAAICWIVKFFSMIRIRFLSTRNSFFKEYADDD